MILEKEILTRDKERDCKILNDFIMENLTETELGTKYGLCQQSISYIIRNNKSLIKIDAEYEKVKRVNRLNRIFSKIGDTLSSKKDILNVITELRHEIEGDSNRNISINSTVNSISFTETESSSIREIINALRTRAISERTS